MMKTSKYLAVALAAMAFASCGNNDEPGNENGGTQGNVLESITVQFVETPSTYADVTEAGVETENSIYHALIFAKEASPKHQNATEGDWTVKEVGTLGATTAIAKGDENTTGTMDNMVSFTGVTQGSNVYVIANDPKLTLAEAEVLAHKGTGSEAAIKAYTTQLDKKYLNSLVLKAGDKPTKQFVMAGMATISTTPVPNNTVLKVPVTLDREMAKVAFTGMVTASNADAAFGKVEIKKEDGTSGTWGTADGLIIVRVPRKVSFFTKQESAWYYPKVGDATTMDWGMDAQNKEWPAFKGNTEKTPSVPGTSSDAFNDVPYNTAPTAAEYRYTWLIDNSGLATYNDDTKKISSPTFYVAPNLTEIPDNSTMVLLQATYTGETTILPEFTQEVITALQINKTTDYWDKKTNLDDLLTKLKAYSGSDAATLALKTKYKDETDANKFVDYKKNQKLFYKAAITDGKSPATERNTQYIISGTITSLGAKSLDDAIASDAIGMVVQVSVNPWRLIRTDINM